MNAMIPSTPVIPVPPLSGPAAPAGNPYRSYAAYCAIGTAMGAIGMAVTQVIIGWFEERRADKMAERQAKALRTELYAPVMTEVNERLREIDKRVIDTLNTHLAAPETARGLLAAIKAVEAQARG